MKIDAIVLAGGKGIKDSPESESKSLVKIAEKPMVFYILNELRKVDMIDKIIISATSQIEKSVSGLYDIRVEPGNKLTDNILESVKKTTSEYVLVVSSDIPLVRKNHLEWFLKESFSTNAHLVMPYSDKESITKSFPKAKRTYGKLKEGTLTLGNMALIRRDIPHKFVSLLEKAEKYRKSIIKLATLLGWSLIFKYILGILSIKDIENRASEILGCKVKGLSSPYPEIGMDVDKLSDLQLVRGELKDS